MKLTVNNKEFNLKITTRGMVDLEKQLGCNPLQVIGNWGENNLPTFSSMSIILHAMLQPLNHGITLNDAYDIMDDFRLEGNNTYDLIPVFIQVLQEGGFIPKDEEPEKN